MSEQYAVKIFTRDKTLLTLLDEPLRRQSCQAEWLQDLASWSPPDHSLPRQVLVIDLELDRDAITAKWLELMSHHAPMLLIPKSGKETSSLAVNLPGATLLADRLTQGLAVALYRLLGVPGRAFLRYPCAMDVEIQTRDSSRSVACCGDISLGGIFVESSCSIPPGDRVSLRIYTHNGQVLLACDACAAWQRATRHGELTRYGTGIQFLFPDRQQLQQLLPHPAYST